MLALLTILAAVADEPEPSPLTDPADRRERTAPPGIPSVPGLMGGDPIVVGQLDKSRIHAVIATDLPAIHACFSETQPLPPDGYLTVTVGLDGKGGTTNVHLKNSVINSPKVESCVVARLERLHFDPPLDANAAVFAYPFMFFRAP